MTSQELMDNFTESILFEETPAPYTGPLGSDEDEDEESTPAEALKKSLSDVNQFFTLRQALKSAIVSAGLTPADVTALGYVAEGTLTDPLFEENKVLMYGLQKRGLLNILETVGSAGGTGRNVSLTTLGQTALNAGRRGTHGRLN